MKDAPRGHRLKTLRLAAGLTQRQLAERIGVIHSNINFWENSDTLPRSEVLPALADALGVGVEQLLGNETSGRKRGKPPGKAGQVFEQVAKLPRSQQARILGVVEDMLARHHAKAS